MSNDEDKPFDIGVLDPATFPARGASPLGLATPELQLLCVRCWSAVKGFSEAKCASCQAPRPPPGWPTLPYVFRQRYLFMRPIGRGGMGAVFLAYDEQQHHGTKVPLAVKVVPQASSAESRQQLRELFEREASAAAMLAQAPHFVRVLAHDVGVDPAYLVMEHVDWPTLRDCIRQSREEGRSGGLSSVVVARIGIAVLRGVSVMHYHRVVHRDLKPSNIFFRRNDTDDFDIKILDFGVWTREASDDASHDSVVGLGHRLDQVPVGTYSYMSPEQMAGRPVNARSDLHTLGSVLWELATGDVPYRMNHALGGRAQADRFERLRSLPVKPSAMNDGFYEILGRALAFDPAERWESAEEMKLALKVWLAEEVLRTKTAFTGYAGRIETLDAQVEHVKTQLAPARDLLHKIDQLSGLVYLLKSQADDATPEAVSSAVEEMEHRIGELAQDLGGFSREVLETSLRLSRDKTEDLGPSVDLPPLRDPAEQREAAFVGPAGPRLVFLASVFSALVAAVAFTVVLTKRGIAPPPAAPSPAPALALTRAEPKPVSNLDRGSEAPSVAGHTARPEPSAPPRILPAGHSRGPVLVAFEPARRVLFTAGRDGALFEVDPASGKTHRTARFTSPVLSLAIHPSSTLAAVGLEDGRLILLETTSGRSLFERRGEGSPLQVLRFSPRGRYLAFPGGGDAPRVLKVDSLEERELGESTARRRAGARASGSVQDIVFSEDGGIVYALGPKGTVRTFDLETGRALKRPLQLESPDARRIAIAAGGTKLVYADGRGRLHARPLEGGRGAAAVARPSEGPVEAFEVHADALYLARREGGLEVIDLGGKDEPRILGTELGPIASLALDPSGERLFAAETSRRVQVLSLREGRPERSFPPGPSALIALAVSESRGELAVVEAGRPEVGLYDARTWTQRRRASAGAAPLCALTYLADGRLLAGDEAGGLWLWVDAEPRARSLGAASGHPVTAVVADPQQRRLFVARGRHGVEQIDLETGRTLRRLDVGKTEVTGLALSQDGIILAASTADGRLLAFETERARRIHSVEVSRAALRAVAFSPDGRVVAATGDEGSVFVYRTDTATLLRTHRDEGGPAVRLAFTDAGRRIVVGRADGSIQAFEATGPRRVFSLAAHAGPITGLWPDTGEAVLSVSLDGTLRSHGPRGEPRRIGGGAGADWTGFSLYEAESCRGPACERFRVEAAD